MPWITLKINVCGRLAFSLGLVIGSEAGERVIVLGGLAHLRREQGIRRAGLALLLPGLLLLLRLR